MSDIYISDKELWQRPFTTRMYLHPPFCEEMATIWAQFMFMLGDVYKKTIRQPPLLQSVFFMERTTTNLTLKK